MQENLLQDLERKSKSSFVSSLALIKTLKILVCEAENVIAADIDGKSDPLLFLTVAKKTQVTSCKKSTLHPVWNEMFDFELRGHCEVKLHLKDKDPFGYDDIGTGMLTLDQEIIHDLIDGQTVVRWVELTQNQKPAGRVKLILSSPDHKRQETNLLKGGEFEDSGKSCTHVKEPHMRYLFVKLKEAVVPPVRGITDAYVKLSAGTMTVQSSVRFKTLRPVWDELHVLGILVVDRHTLDNGTKTEIFADSLRIEIFDWGSVASTCISKLNIPLHLIPEHTGKDDPAPKRITFGKCELLAAYWFDSGYEKMPVPPYVEQIFPRSIISRSLVKQPTPVATLRISMSSPIFDSRSKLASGHKCYAIVNYAGHWVKVPQFDNRNLAFACYHPSEVMSVAIYEQKEGMWRKSEKIRGVVRIPVCSLPLNKQIQINQSMMIRYDSKIRRVGELPITLELIVKSYIPFLQTYISPPKPDRAYYRDIDDKMVAINKFHKESIIDYLSTSGGGNVFPKESLEHILFFESPSFDLPTAMAHVNRAERVLAYLSRLSQTYDDICTWKSLPLSVFANLYCLLVIYDPLWLLYGILAGLLTMLLPGLFDHYTGHYTVPEADPSLMGGLDTDPKEEAEPTEINLDPRKYFEKVEVFALKAQETLSTGAGVLERVQNLFAWRNPTVSLMCTCAFAIALFWVMLLPIKPVLMLLGLFLLRHPQFRDPLPPPPLNLVYYVPTERDRIVSGLKSSFLGI